ncbi:HD domain-containing protein [Clostridium tarantellae]|uniref:HD domain-containing protein n=1 Tax=Clostridium tarantellae TaxID=39493 RepID=A0A6I1MPQ5_9CLOT|nr:HD domain-containing protein [Clostridium tarantellae]MPQ44117.1 HD domain-containing protein [Clostridium tarantellae]
MKKVNNIVNNFLYKEYLKKNNEYEFNREFCKHNMEHFLNMARISYIICLEKNIPIDKEIIYAIALLHDIGRWKEYKEGIPHEKASYELSGDILVQCGFNSNDITIIKDAILNHRNKYAKGINKIFYESDKLSRSCFICKSENKCKWSKEKKNMLIKY